MLDDVPGAEVVALDNLGFAASLANLAAVRERIRFVEANIADLAAARGSDGPVR